MAAEAKQKPEAKEQKEHKEKKTKAPTEEAAAAAPKPPPAPRQPPTDPRLKLLEQFRGRLLPKGVLRDRYKVLMQRWDSADDHGGVTVEELKSLFDDRKATREKRYRKA